MARKRSSQSGWVWTAIPVALVLAVVGVAWGDHVSDSGRTVAANVWFLDTDVSGLEVARVEEVVAARANEILATEITVDTGDGDIGFVAGEVGFGYQSDRVVAEILSARHAGDLARRVLDWVGSPFRPVRVTDRIEYDRQAAESHLGGDLRLLLSEPVDPVITMEGANEFYVVPGAEGGRVDVADLASRLGDRNPIAGPITIDARRVGLPPSVDDGQAQTVADSLNDVTAQGVEILVGSAHVTIGPSLLRRNIEVAMTGGNIVVHFDSERLHGVLEGLIDEPVTDLEEPTIEVEDDRPRVMRRGKPPLACCEARSVRRAGELIMAGARGPIRVDPRPSDDPRLAQWASGDPVTEKVGEFTTMHQCCQSRVTNIHRIADIVRGLYLIPGETVSLNEYVGQRTRENGFVPAGAIRSGRLEDEVGGGVSQFATTIFNAAFFSGLDIPVYQAHSLYFSRYPFGREATISHPAPDLVLHNATDHPVLIWTSYTDTSITVSMYSTPNVEVEETGQRVQRWGQCTHVETDRQRTFADGRVVVDTFEALYRPAEGIDCNGNPIPRSP